MKKVKGVKVSWTANLFLGIAVSLCGLVPVTSHAQSSVQLYGLIDEWIGVTKYPGSQGAVNLGGGGMSTSYWGVKGAEDLGGGYKTVFALESFFRPQNGEAGRFTGDHFFARSAYVGVEAPWGTLTVGHQTTELFISTILFEPFQDSFTFAPMIFHTYMNLGTFPTYPTDQGVVGDSGWDNAVQYSSPRFNGLSFAAMYGLGDTAGDNGTKKYSAQFLYFNGPFAATGVYQYVNYNYSPGDLSDLIEVPGFRGQGVAQIGLSYDAKLVKFYGQYMYTRNETDTGAFHVNTGQFGISIPAGVGAVNASYAYSRDTGGMDQRHQTAAVGYDYPVSKRTDLYAAYMYDKYSDLPSGNTYGVGIRSRF